MDVVKFLYQTNKKFEKFPKATMICPAKIIVANKLSEKPISLNWLTSKRVNLIMLNQEIRFEKNIIPYAEILSSKLFIYKSVVLFQKYSVLRLNVADKYYYIGTSLNNYPEHTIDIDEIKEVKTNWNSLLLVLPAILIILLGLIMNRI